MTTDGVLRERTKIEGEAASTRLLRLIVKNNLATRVAYMRVHSPVCGRFEKKNGEGKKFIFFFEDRVDKKIYFFLSSKCVKNIF